MLMTASLLTRMPITVREWRMRLTDLCHRSAMAEAQDEGAMLRMGYHLLSRLPDNDSLLADHLPPQARFDTWLAAGTHDSAALALIPETGSFLLSRNGDGTCLASVMLPGLDEEMTSEGTTPALALVSALAAALATVDVQGQAADAEAAHTPDVAREELWRAPSGIALH